MKKPGNKNSSAEPSTIAITATLLQPRLLEYMVERLADRRYDIGYSQERMQPGWMAAETSSVEAHAGGDINISVKDEIINLPFITSFIFTCTKAKGQEYQMTWISSLS